MLCFVFLVPGGLTLREGVYIVEKVAASGLFITFTFCTVSSSHYEIVEVCAQI